MLRILPALFILVLILLSTFAGFADNSLGEYAVKVFNNQREGSGVITSKGILTAAHVVRNEKEESVELLNGAIYPGIVIRESKELDLALIKVKLPAAIVPCRIARLEPSIDEPIQMCGCGGYHDFAPRHGRVVDENSAQLYLDINGLPGDSGSGIFNEDGELVGILQACEWVDTSVVPIKGYIVSSNLETTKRFLK
jgi:S1-C subfamily serine protease